MKRAAACEADDERKSSKPRLNVPSFPFDNHLDQNPFDIFENGPNPAGFIRGKFFMVWRPSASAQKFLAVVEVAPEPSLKYTDSRTVRFQVEFSGRCAKFFHIFTDSISVATHFILSLEGAHLDKRSSSSVGLPMTISFPDGVKIKCTRSHKEVVIDTWMMEKLEEAQDANWFSTPLVTSKRCSLISGPPADEGGNPIPLQPSLQSSNANIPSISVNDTRPPPDGLAPQPLSNSISSTMLVAPNQPLTAKQKKKQKRAARASLGVSETANLDHAVEKQPVEISSVMPSPTTELSNPSPKVPSDHGTYTLLKDIASNGHCQHNVAGVVIYKSSPKQVDSSKDWHCSFRMVDPGNANLEVSASFRGIQVNCFKKAKHWLPCPELGDIIILRGVKVSMFRGNLTLAGYHDILCWAIFSSTKVKIHHGDETEVSAPEMSTAGSRSLHFFDPKESDLQYCQKLSSWWCNLQNGEKNNAQENAVANMYQVPIGGGVRRHCLIREAHPDRPPCGYFDCTVEVLAGFPNLQDNIYSLYVTDYTCNKDLYPVQAKWCPASMATLVLKIEMWDSAATLGRRMEKGSFYHIRNARMKRSNYGCLEGKVVEQKITQLEEGESETNLYLRALLERKQAWEKVEDSSAQFEHRLIEDAVEDSFFNGTVEILRLEESDGPCLYVTDYTAHPQLSPNYSGTWTLNLQGRILRVLLDNEQYEMAKLLNVPAYYRINKLRLRMNKAVKLLHGFLGGNERKIQNLTLDAGDERYAELIRRKSLWQQQTSSAPVQGLYYSTIKQILEFDRYPNKHRIFVRVIKMYPPDLRNAIILFCSRCKSEIDPSRKACYDCYDFDHEYVQYLYHLALAIEDKEGQQLAVSVDDDCHLFNDLRRIDIRDNSEAQIKLRDRLKPFLGALVDLHQPLGMDAVQSTAFHTLVIECWKNSEGVPSFGLARVGA